MPQLDVKYSQDIVFDVDALFSAIEKIINKHDPTAGLCKSRGYATSSYQHQHLLIDLRVLKKPHRDDDFMQALLADFEELMKTLNLPKQCSYAIHVDFISPYYISRVNE